MVKVKKNNKQKLFNKVIRHIQRQGLDRTTLYCPVAKTMCAIGFLYADAFSRKRLSNLVEEHLINDLLGSSATNQVIRELIEKYPDVPVYFFRGLVIAHDAAIIGKITFEETAKQFALKWGLDYSIPLRGEEGEEDESHDPYEELPWAA